jgi:hypothetical protein
MLPLFAGSSDTITGTDRRADFSRLCGWMHLGLQFQKSSGALSAASPAELQSALDKELANDWIQLSTEPTLVCMLHFPIWF